MEVAEDVNTLSRLIADCRAAQAKMSRKNDHRAILRRCELALMDLLKQQPEHSTPEAVHAGIKD